MRRHQFVLYNFLRHHLRDPSAAEDLVQDTFMRVAQNASEFRADARFVTWLYAIARNLSVDYFRRNALRQHPSLDQARHRSGDDKRTLGDVVPDPRVQADVERTVDAQRMKERLLRAIDTLPEEQREVYLMRELTDVPFKDIAEIMGVPINTVKTRMRYALERLQRALGEFEEHMRALT